MKSSEFHLGHGPDLAWGAEIVSPEAVMQLAQNVNGLDALIRENPELAWHKGLISGVVTRASQLDVGVDLPYGAHFVQISDASPVDGDSTPDWTMIFTTGPEGWSVWWKVETPAGAIVHHRPLNDVYYPSKMVPANPGSRVAQVFSGPCADGERDIVSGKIAEARRRLEQQ